MADNLMIRKIDLHSNCDLSNYDVDVHDYEGFKNCNSLFLNKRLQTWYKRPAEDSRVIGNYRIYKNGNNFDLYNGATLKGSVSRYYYKLEEWNGSTTNVAQLKNPYPQGKEKVLCKLASNEVIQQASSSQRITSLSNGWYIVSNSSGLVDIYDNNDNLKVSRSNMGSNTVISGYYASGAQTFEVGRSYGLARLSLNAGDILVTSGNGLKAFIYNVNTQAFRYDALYIKNNEGDFSATSSDSETLCQLSASQSVYGISALVCVLGGVLYMQLVMPWGLMGDARTYHLIGRMTSGTVTQLLSTQYNGTSYNNTLSLTQTSSDSYGGKAFKLIFKCGSHSTEYTTTTSALRHYVEFHNYSIKLSAGFAINFVNNVAQNIADNYKKLINIEGNENSSGVLTDIINYGLDSSSRGFIIFKKNNKYYRISCALAEDWHEVVQIVRNDYLVFNTTTYLNAFYIPGERWFCSCDDWNNRLIWRVKNDTNFEGFVNSRLNQNWQTLTYPVSVSDQNASIISRYAVTGLNMTAYPSSATWDGSSVIYDSSGNPVYTGDWAQGHSLNGYYYPGAWTVNTAGMTPFYYSGSYTAPAGVQYTVFMADTSGGTLGALHKVGVATSSGFTAGTGAESFIDPQNYNYQLNCPLLDAQYYIFTTTGIVIIDGESYALLQNTNMGNFVLLYNSLGTVIVTAEDKQFVINGSVYTYRAQAQRIVDSNNKWVCETQLFHYIGFSSQYAYFYCDFDKGLYIFCGDNTMQRIAVIERYSIRYSAAEVDTLNLPSIGLILLNLNVAVGVIYGDQVAIIETGYINNWRLDNVLGAILINDTYYSLILENLQSGYTGEISRLPVKIETNFFGDSENESNVINECVYLTIDNLNGIDEGNVKLKVEVLQNNKVVKSEEKSVYLSGNDFTENMAQVKYQPKIQEGRGFKLYVESDFEVSEMKFATAPGALNQTTKRI